MFFLVNTDMSVSHAWNELTLRTVCWGLTVYILLFCKTLLEEDIRVSFFYI